jgi:thiol:disulfide interchange protein
VNRELKRFLIKVAVCAGIAAFLHGATFTFLGGTIPYLVPGVLVASAAYLGFLDRTLIENGAFLKRGVALLFGAFAVWLAVPQSESGVIPWQAYDLRLVEAARKGGRPVMIEFITQSCPYCVQMERNVFSRRNIARAAEPFLTLRADLTLPNAETKKLAEQLRIEAFPTVVFLAPDGSERTNLRLVGYERAENFLQRLQQAR